MRIVAIKTEKILPAKKSILELLDKYLISVREKSILAITSKIIALCEGRVASKDEISKKKLIEKEAEYFIPPEESKYNISLTIKNGLLIPTAGIDESNVAGGYVLWPSNPQKTANNIRKYLCKRFSLDKVGVIITDSKTSPLRWGTTGIALAHSGFLALKNYIGKPDIFNKKLNVTKANITDALATATNVVMGEGNEQTPIAVIEDIPFVAFQKRNPTQKELDSLKISLEDDLYAPLLTSVNWRERGK